MWDIVKTFIGSVFLLACAAWVAFSMWVVWLIAKCALKYLGEYP